VEDGEDFFQDGQLSPRSRVFKDEAYGNLDRLIDFSDDTFEVSVGWVAPDEQSGREKKSGSPRRGRSRGTLKNFSVQELAKELKTGRRKKKIRKMSVTGAGSNGDKDSGAVVPRKKVDFTAQKSDNSSSESEEEKDKLDLVSFEKLTRFIRKMGKPEGEKRAIPVKELPTFRGEPNENAMEFLIRYERRGELHDWGDAEKLKYLYLTLERNAMDWHRSNLHLKTWREMKDSFIATFGKNWVDVDFDQKANHKLAIEDPLAYVSRIVRNFESSDPLAPESAKINKLLTGLPSHLKIHFVTNTPKTVIEFTNGLQNAARIQQLSEESVMSSGNLGILTTLLQNRTLSNSSNISQLLQTSNITSAPVMAAFQSQPVTSQLEASVGLANNEMQMKKLIDRFDNLESRLRTQSSDVRNQTQNRFRNTVSKKICNFCRKPGHIEIECYKKNGFPNRNQPNNGPPASVFRASQPVFYLPMEQQYQQQYSLPPYMSQPHHTQPYYSNTTPPPGVGTAHRPARPVPHYYASLQHQDQSPLQPSSNLSLNPSARPFFSSQSTAPFYSATSGQNTWSEPPANGQPSLN
jgi:hypothetical protein